MVKQLAAVLVLIWPLSGQAAGVVDWFLTSDQQGDRLYQKERYSEAAAAYEDPMRKGVAFYRAGEFEKAASVFGRLSTAEAAFNRGNALIFLGRYDEAIASFETALQRQPGWSEAQDNLELARVRKAALAPPEDDAGGTGGKLGADEIVFDDTGRVNKGGTETVVDGGEAMSDEQMRAVWLRRVENKPADFLRARFSYQLYVQEQGQNEEHVQQGVGEAGE